MKFEKTYADKCVTYYESGEGNTRVEIIMNNKTGVCKIKTDFSIFNIMGKTAAETKTLDEAFALFN